MTKYCYVEGCGGVSVTIGAEHLCRRHYERKFVELLSDWDDPISATKRKWYGHGANAEAEFANWNAFLKDWKKNRVPQLVKKLQS